MNAELITAPKEQRPSESAAAEEKLDDDPILTQWPLRRSQIHGAASASSWLPQRLQPPDGLVGANQQRNWGRTKREALANLKRTLGIDDAGGGTVVRFTGT